MGSMSGDKTVNRFLNNVYLKPFFNVTNSYAMIVALVIYLGFIVSSDAIARPLLIAHAGGGIDGNNYTNSLEALNANYAKGFRYFEIDFSWTSDEQLVCLHDWKKRFKQNFGFKTKKALSLKQFQNLLGKQNRRHPCTLETLSNWVALHPGSKIITDVKYDNLKAIKHIVKYDPSLIENLIPQFYQPDEYKTLKQIGFKQLIWILYQFDGKKSSIAGHAKDMELLAISMRASQVKKKWAKELLKNNHSIFVYTINKITDLKKLSKKHGVTGIYTDFISPDYN